MPSLASAVLSPDAFSERKSLKVNSDEKGSGIEE